MKIQKSRYLVFLDIDGVFTSNRVHYAHNADYNTWHRFDPVAVDFMNKIHDLYPVEFVLMSTWKNNLPTDSDMTEHWVKSAFGNSGFRGKFAAPWKTDPENILITNTSQRAVEVQKYLLEHGSDAKDFILFDDNSYDFDVILCKRRLVRTDADNGLLHRHMKDAMSIMGQWNKK